MNSGQRDPRFDPRFDPAFQPGFDPDTHRPGPGRLSGHGAPAAPRASRFAAPDDGEPDAPDWRSARSEPPRSGQGIAEHVCVDTRVSDERRSVPLGQNPYVWALWVVVPGMVIAGFLLYWWANNDPGGFAWEGSRPPFLFLLQQSAWVMAPALVTVGLAGLVGLLFLHASRWRPGGRADGGHTDDAAEATPAS